MSDDGPDAIGKNFASYLKAEGLPSNEQLADWLRSAYCAASGEFVSISGLAALLIVERLGQEATNLDDLPQEERSNPPSKVLDGGSSRVRRGRPQKTGPKLGEKTDLEDMDLLFSFWVFREQFENNNESAPVERAYKAVADQRKIKVESAKQALNRAVKRTGQSLRVPRVP